MRTTAPPPVSVADLFPELAGREAVTVRLHPRRAGDSGPTASKMGGRIHWPPGEAWPTCDQAHLGFDIDDLSTFEAPPDDRPFVPVLQLRRSDVPELDFAGDTDLFQLLWCPETHANLYAPLIRTYWRRAADLVDVIAPPAFPALDNSQYVPGSCVVSPERVTEYPDPADLEPAIQQRVFAWEETQSQPTYQWWLSAAPGTKVGGYPDWLQDPQPQLCPNGHPMDFLLTIADTEFDGGTWQRWLPLEEAGLWDGPTQARLDVQEPADLQFGMGSIYVFICRRCPDRPIAQVYQR
ncbi:MAG TPA: hypothetical protein VFO05_10030 [Candidatus Limnocylindrales bacterium]|nr:hypothetical protein [Candidatus Limnocylindrales bacterium]